MKEIVYHISDDSKNFDNDLECEGTWIYNGKILSKGEIT